MNAGDELKLRRWLDQRYVTERTPESEVEEFVKDVRSMMHLEPRDKRTLAMFPLLLERVRELEQERGGI